MHAPSLARVIDGNSVGVGGMVSGEAVGRGLRGRDTARLDVSLHDVIRSVPACCYPRIQGLPEYYDCSYARWSTSSNSRPVRGPEPRERGTKWMRRGSLCKVRQDFWGKACFSSAAVRKGACRDVGRWVSEPRPEDFPGTGNRGKVCCGGVSVVGLLLSLLCYLGQAVTFG